MQVKVGEDESDPVFYISDLLPHLAAKQNQKPLGNAIEGEQLNIWFGNIPYTAATEDDEKTVKNNVLHLLNDKYGITEADFMSAELSMVPAFKAKDVGFDRALLGMLRPRRPGLRVPRMESLPGRGLPISIRLWLFWQIRRRSEAREPQVCRVPFSRILSMNWQQPSECPPQRYGLIPSVCPRT